MDCPFCNHTASRVVDSRESPEGVRRRRECSACYLRFTTYERIHTIPLMISKRDGRSEPFSRDKLERSWRIACAKRPLELGSISKMVTDIENELYKINRAEVESRIIGEMTIERLRILDRVAYIRYASVYRDFQDEVGFAKEIESLQDVIKDEPTEKEQLLLVPDDVPRIGNRRKHNGQKRKKNRKLPIV